MSCPEGLPPPPTVVTHCPSPGGRAQRGPRGACAWLTVSQHTALGPIHCCLCCPECLDHGCPGTNMAVPVHSRKFLSPGISQGPKLRGRLSPLTFRGRVRLGLPRKKGPLQSAGCQAPSWSLGRKAARMLPCGPRWGPTQGDPACRGPCPGSGPSTSSSSGRLPQDLGCLSLRCTRLCCRQCLQISISLSWVRCF